MRLLKRLREYQGGDIARYLTTEFRQVLRTLDQVLTTLKMAENFGGFEWEGTIGASETMEIRNKLNPVIPSRRIILRTQQGNLSDTSDEWTKDLVYIRNNAGSPDRVKIVFLP